MTKLAKQAFNLRQVNLPFRPFSVTAQLHELNRMNLF